MFNQELKIYDPVTAEVYPTAKYNFLSEGQVEGHASRWGTELVKARSAIHKTGVHDPVLRRYREMHRYNFQDIAVACLIGLSEDKPQDVRHWKMAHAEAPGVMQFVCYLHSGNWRLATEEEELRHFEIEFIKGEESRRQKCEDDGKTFVPRKCPVESAREWHAAQQAKVRPPENKPAVIGTVKGK